MLLRPLGVTRRVVLLQAWGVGSAAVRAIGPRFARTFGVALSLCRSGIVAIVTRDPKRRAACHKVLDTLTRRDSSPPPENPDL